MAVEIKMPKMGVSMVTGVVTKWLKAEGDAVKKGEEVAEIETEKITNTVEALADGILLKIVAKEGDELPIGALMGLIGNAGETVSIPSGAAPAETSPKEGAPSQNAKIMGMAEKTDAGNKILITPVARKMAQENGIDYTQLIGTGPGGRITKEDIEKAMAGGPIAPEPAVSEIINVPKAAQQEFETIPYSGMRKAIGDNLSNSWKSAPKVNHHGSVDVTDLLAFRKTLNEGLEKKDCVSVTDLLIKIVAKAIEMYPRINVSLSENSVKILKNINIGMAVALDNGLVVPVIKNANLKSLSQISSEVKELAKRARENKLTKDDMSGATFTISNLGSYNSVDFFTPIINQPESAILGVGRTVEIPAVVDGQIVIRSMMGLSLAFDHRVIDGAPAAEFLAAMMKLIQKPCKMFM